MGNNVLQVTQEPRRMVLDHKAIPSVSSYQGQYSAPGLVGVLDLSSFPFCSQRRSDPQAPTQLCKRPMFRLL